MNEQDIDFRFKYLIAGMFDFPIEAIKDEMKLADPQDQGGLNADSLDLIEMMIWVEEEFGIDISEEQAETIKTVADGIALIKEKVK